MQNWAAEQRDDGTTPEEILDETLDMYITTIEQSFLAGKSYDEVLQGWKDTCTTGGFPCGFDLDCSEKCISCAKWMINQAN